MFAHLLQEDKWTKALIIFYNTPHTLDAMIEEDRPILNVYETSDIVMTFNFEKCIHLRVFHRKVNYAV